MRVAFSKPVHAARVRIGQPGANHNEKQSAKPSAQILGAICAGDDKGLAAIDVDLVHFSKLIVSWNAMENVIRAVHVRNCASYTSACVCPTSSASDEAQQILFMVSSIFVFQDYSLKSLHIITTNQAISEVNRAVTKQLNGNQTQTKSMNVGQ